MIKAKNQPTTLVDDLQNAASSLLGVALGDVDYLEDTMQHSSLRRIVATVAIGSLFATLIVVLYQALFQTIIIGESMVSAQAAGTVIWHLVTQALVMLFVIYSVSHLSYKQLHTLRNGEPISLTFIEHMQMLAVLIAMHTIIGQLATTTANLFMVEQFGLASGTAIIFIVMGVIAAATVYFWVWVWRSYRLFHGLRRRELMTVFAATFVSYTMINFIYGWIAPMFTSPITDYLMW